MVYNYAGHMQIIQKKSYHSGGTHGIMLSRDDTRIERNEDRSSICLVMLRYASRN